MQIFLKKEAKSDEILLREVLICYINCLKMIASVSATVGIGFPSGGEQ